MDKIEEIRRKELDVQNKQLFADRVTVAAVVASAVAAHRQAAATEQIRQQMAADSEREAEHQIQMAACQREMAEEQRLTNFRNTVLATLPLLKDEQEKKQHLTEQLLPELKCKINTSAVSKFSPIWVVSASADDVLKDYVENKAGQDLKEFLSVGKDILDRAVELTEKSKTWQQEREKQFSDLKKEQGELTSGIIVIWLLTVLSSVAAYFMDFVSEEVSPFVGRSFSLFLSYKKSRGLKLKPNHLPNRTTLQDEKWEVFKPQVVEYLMVFFRDVFTRDPRALLLEIVSGGLESLVNDLQSFLPPSARLPASHYAEYLVDDTDVEAFRNDQSSVENELKSFLVPFYKERTIVFRNE